MSADSNSAIVKHILDSGLSNVEKIDLIKNLFIATSGAGGNFLGNLAGIQGLKQKPVSTLSRGIISGWRGRPLTYRKLKPFLRRNEVVEI